MSYFYTLKVVKSEVMARNAKVLELEVPKHLKDQYIYKAGQHLTFRIFLNGKEERRSYSLCQSEGKSPLKVGIRRLSHGIFSSWVFDNLHVGMELEVMPPQGFFQLKSIQETTHQVFFAAGSGITPILSLLEQSLEHSTARICLFYSNKSLQTSMFLETLEDLKNRFMTRLELHYFFSQERQSADWLNGRLDQEKIKTLWNFGLIPKNNAHYYICGPETMIEDIKTALIEMKVNKHFIHFESFGMIQKRKNIKPSVSNAKSNILYKLYGKTFQIEFANAESLLDAGLKAGLNLPYACQAGVCGTCRCRLLEGKVDMQQNNALEQHELKQGLILACQSMPKTKKLLIDFDV